MMTLKIIDIMKKLLFRPFLSSLAVLMLCASCDDLFVDADDKDEAPYHYPDFVEPYIPTRIRFEAADSSNMLSLWADVPHEYTTFCRLETLDWIDVSCTRVSDGAKMTFSQSYWYVPKGDKVQIMGDGPQLELSWLDLDWRVSQNNALPRIEHYKIEVCSKRFWLSQKHTIDWGIQIINRNSYGVISCAIDGVESAEYLKNAYNGTFFVGFVRLREY